MAYAKKSVSLQLMFEVRRDAIEKSRSAYIGNRTFHMITHMCDIMYTARKRGILDLDPAVGFVYIPPEDPFAYDLNLALEYFINCYEYLTEILTNRYWVKNLQGEDALTYYLMISAFNKMPDYQPSSLETMLLSCIPDEAVERYREYKKGKTYSYESEE